MLSPEQLKHCHESLLREAEQLAGGLADLAQRAAVYHHLFEHSGRNHIFPLIAAHGAMWAGGYFGWGMKVGWICSWQYAAAEGVRLHRLQQLADFADAFREINRRVCIDTYVSYHFTERFGDHPLASRFVPQPLIEVLDRCHTARRNDLELTDAQKREVFTAFFLNEQQTVVQPSIQRATQTFDWPLVRFLALRPLIRFAYFPKRVPLLFRNFASQEQRIRNGFRAFDLAAQVGWDRVESTLRDYAILPDSFFSGSARYFAEMRDKVLEDCGATCRATGSGVFFRGS